MRRAAIIRHDLVLFDLFKRAFDIALASALFVLLLPLLSIIALLVKTGSRGPVLYRGVRVGRGGKHFRISKFRTMIVDADKKGGPSTADNDPRITRIGHWLRKRKLDELPQLLNVLEGTMSFVGPRPEVAQYASMLRGDERRILEIRPGMTDWASIWNSDEGAVLKGAVDPEKAYLEKIRPEKIRLQLKYVRERSPGVDVKIIFLTAWTLLSRHREPA